jgi:hypothetical protein
MYGEEVPMMLRTRQHRGMDEHGGKLKIAQLDQSLRSIAKEMDVKLFTWGDKLEGWLKCHPFGILPLEQHELISAISPGTRTTINTLGSAPAPICLASEFADSAFTGNQSP